MPNQKILYVTTEMFPYQEGSLMAERVNQMALKMHREGNDVRVFMPRFGLISERKFQLHEVIRLSGMNVIINDLDQPLIIKVASLPGERLQVYFIDNEEFFKRKSYYKDEEGNFFKDNDERAVFFAKGVIETIKKLNWVPDVIHFNGWMTLFIPLYLKEFYKNDFYFNNTQLVMSLYNEEKVIFDDKIKEVLAFDGVKDLDFSSGLNHHLFVKEVSNRVDVLVKGEQELSAEMNEIFENSKVKKVDFITDDDFGMMYK